MDYQSQDSLPFHFWSNFFSTLPFCLYIFLLYLIIFIWDSRRTHNKIRAKITGKWNPLVLPEKTLTEKFSLYFKIMISFYYSGWSLLLVLLNYALKIYISWFILLCLGGANKTHQLAVWRKAHVANGGVYQFQSK